MGAAIAPAVAPEAVVKAVATAAVVAAVAAAVEEKPAPAAEAGELDIATIREKVLEALESQKQEMLSHFIDTPEWSFEGSELVIKVAKSQTMIDMSMGAEAKKLIGSALQSATGRTVRFKVISGGTAAAPPTHRSTARATGGSARTRAAEHPIVRYMQEKFGAEIRTVIDQQQDDE
jgi:hypothetical protein